MCTYHPLLRVCQTRTQKNHHTQRWDKSGWKWASTRQKGLANSYFTPPFTTESELYFENDHLPTLDFETKVQNDGRISYRFFSKRMANNNIVLQRGTALSKECVFSPLLQELLRRSLNSDINQNISVRIALIEKFTQLLVNSDHQFAYINSIIMQALTKYDYMISNLAAIWRCRIRTHELKLWAISTVSVQSV